MDKRFPKVGNYVEEPYWPQDETVTIEKHLDLNVLGLILNIWMTKILYFILKAQIV